MFQHPGHQILSGTVFAQNQDIGICIRETENRVLDLTHGRRFADEFRQGSIVAQSRNLFLQAVYFFSGLAELDGREEGSE